MNRLRYLEALIAVLSLVIFVGLLLFGFFDSLESKTLNWRFRARGEERSRSKIVLVLITDECLSRLGTWPISRSLYASVVDKLSLASASAIAFDIVFEENSTVSSNGDEDFVASCFRCGNVLLPLVFSEMQVFTKTAVSPERVEEVRLPLQSLF